MLTEPINASVKGLDPLPQARLPAEMGEPSKSKVSENAEKKPDLSSLTELVADVQKNLNMINNVDLQFTVHEASGDIMVIVTDESTGDVIREIPPSEILNIAARLDEMIGLIFDQKG